MEYPQQINPDLLPVAQENPKAGELHGIVAFGFIFSISEELPMLDFERLHNA